MLGAPDEVWVGIDPGTVRCGVASSDPSLTLASPLGVVQTEPHATLGSRIVQLLGPRSPINLVIGLPLDQRGREGDSARLARELGALIGSALGLEPEYIDERFTTRETTLRQREAGRKQKQIAQHVDAHAAAAILQSALDRR